jgi:membrane protease YdiL (CAAX protease family)
MYWILMQLKKWSVLTKIGLFWGLYLGVIFITGRLQPMVPPLFGPLLWGTASVPLVYLLNYLFARHERRPLSDLWIRFRGRDGANLILGLGIGLSMLPLTIALCAIMIGSIRVGQTNSHYVSAIFMAIVGIALLVLMEELGFRAYSLSTLVTAIGRWKGQLLTAAAFAACHVLFGWSIQSIVTGVLPSGLLFGAGAYATRSMSTAVGIHMGMNFAQWAIRDNEGIVKLVIDTNIQPSVQTAATWINLTLVLAWCFAFWFKRAKRPIHE